MQPRRKTKAIAFSGLSIALIEILLFMGSVVDVFDYTVSAICGLVITFILVEFGTGTAVSAYLGASILALLLIPNKINAILFVAFCGWYPFVKRYLEKAREPIGTVLKFFVFNLALLVIFIISSLFFPSEKTVLWLYAILYVICNATFFLYDVLITKLIWIYVHKFRKKLTFLK